MAGQGPARLVRGGHRFGVGHRTRTKGGALEVAHPFGRQLFGQPGVHAHCFIIGLVVDNFKNIAI
jgi:hypothetical protein